MGTAAQETGVDAMSNLRTAAQQALEALQNCANGEDDVLLTRDALADLSAALEKHAKDVEWMKQRYANWRLQKELAEQTQERDRQRLEYEEVRNAALEQPEQEPVAWIHRKHYLLGHAENMPPADKALAQGWEPLYTHPPRREQPEQPEQPEQEVKGCDHCNHPLYAAIKCHACGRVTEQEQEPVAWCDIEEDGTIHGLRYWSEPGRREHALYTHPPRREWRSLSEEEIESLWRKWVGTQRPNYSFTRAVEAALKERNI